MGNCFNNRISSINLQTRLIRAHDQVFAFHQEDRQPNELKPEIGELWGFIEGKDHCDLFLGQGLLMMKRTYLTPWSFVYELPEDKLIAKMRRLQIGRLILSYYLDEVLS